MFRDFRGQLMKNFCVRQIFENLTNSWNLPNGMDVKILCSAASLGVDHIWVITPKMTLLCQPLNPQIPLWLIFGLAYPIRGNVAHFVSLGCIALCVQLVFPVYAQFFHVLLWLSSIISKLNNFECSMRFSMRFLV